MSIYLESLRNDVAFEKAKQLGLEVVVPDSRTLTLDFDMPELPESYYERREMLDRIYPVESQVVTRSKSGNLHVRLTFGVSFTMVEKVALQAALGSDPKREILSLVRVKEGNLGEPSLLFEVPTGGKLIDKASCL